MFSTVLIANRGEIALRIIRTCRELGVRSVVVYSSADRGSRAVQCADEAVCIGPPQARHSYLNAAAIIAAALKCGADAIHPGYGFLSEDADFAAACTDHGLTFIGPRPTVLEALADKARVREFAAAAGLTVLPGTDRALATADEAMEVASRIGFPLILKAVAGGGGRGIAVVKDRSAFLREYAANRASAQAIFGDPGLYVERYLEHCRHVEIQILADRHGNVVHLGARDCSVQRRRQKLIEEGPPVGLPGDLVGRMGAAAAHAARQAGYEGAGTFEFVVDSAGNPYFIEINCRIQVEHPVTEMLTGVDIVREQLRIASGEKLRCAQSEICSRGHAIECRINAEDPNDGFLPSPGLIEKFAPPGGAFTRVDTHCYAGMRVAAMYDPLLAKLIVWAPDRGQALCRMDRALAEFEATGPRLHTTIDFLREILAHPLFQDAKHSTCLVDEMLGSAA